MFGILGHTLRGCVDWNRNGQRYCYYGKSHTLRGCVDWNDYAPSSNGARDCHTLRGCVDWNIFWTHCKCTKRSHPAWVCGLKLGSLRRIHYGRCHTLRGWVDWNNDEVNTCIDNHSHTLRGCIWIEALFTRWSSLWKNCKHSASCVFLFKLL